MNGSEPTKPWPQHGLEAVARCPMCGSGARTLVHADMTDRVFFCAPGEWNLFRCADCPTGYLDPRPTADTIGLAYASYYTHAPAGKPDTGTLSRARRVRRSIANGYRNHRYGTRDRPATSAGALLALLPTRSRAVIDTESRHLPRPRPGARLLDVGCGEGHFLAFAQRAGWSVTGVDVDERAVRAAGSRGLDVRLGGVEALGPEERFDGITLSHVIEHVHDPRALLRSCHRLLEPGGWIWLQTPNLDALGHRHYGIDWRGLEPPRHLVLFTPASLGRALTDAGFVDVRSQPGAPACAFTFSASEAIARGEGAAAEDRYVDMARPRIEAAEREAARNPAIREFITVKAVKPR